MKPDEIYKIMHEINGFSQKGKVQMHNLIAFEGCEWYY